MENKDALQFSATVIAGALIFLTLAVSENTSDEAATTRFTPVASRAWIMAWSIMVPFAFAAYYAINDFEIRYAKRSMVVGLMILMITLGYNAFIALWEDWTT